jgi:DNA-binding response OmpR family regulator
MGGTERPRVVVVDEHTDGGRTVCAVLGAAGFDAVTTPDVASAAGAVGAEGVSVVLVANSAGRSARSTDVVRTLRSSVDADVRDVSVVVLVDDAGGADAALASGADSVLVRPVESARIVEAVTEVVAVEPSVRAERRRAR